MENNVNLVCFGEILPGHDREEVKRQLSALLKLSAGQVETVLAGRRVVLKKGLSAQDAPRYQQHLANIGVKVEIEPETPSAPPSVPAPAPQAQPLESAPAGLALEPAAPEEITCPKCGERQPKRTLCRSCSLDMPRYLASQQAAKEEAQAAKASDNGYMRLSAEAQDVVETKTPMFGVDFSGRIGRAGYFTGGVIMITVLVLIMMATFKPESTSGFGFVGLYFLVMIFFGLRLTVLRLHDCGWSGWFVFLFFIPLVNSLLNLILLFMPGNRDDNEYGSQPASLGMAKFFGALAVMFITTSIFSSQSMSAYKAYVEKSKAKAAESQSQEAPGPQLPHYQPGVNTVIMYTKSGCSACDRTNNALSEAGLFVNERRIDQDSALMQELVEKLQRSGRPMRSVALPVLDVNGDILPNNPSLDEIAEHLHGAMD